MSDEDVVHGTLHGDEEAKLRRCGHSMDGMTKHLGTTYLQPT